MAKKKVPTIEDAIKSFNNIIERASLSNYYYVNKILLSKNQKGNSILIVPDETLWLKLIDDEEFKSAMKDIDLSNPEEYKLQQLFSYAESLDTGWTEIDAKEILFPGKVFKISLNGFDYEVPINRDFLPLKLRKAEYCDISYKIFTTPQLVLSLKKRFDSPVEDGGFTMIRLFQVI